jgi:hypothetical protein
MSKKLFFFDEKNDDIKRKNSINSNKSLINKISRNSINTINSINLNEITNINVNNDNNNINNDNNDYNIENLVDENNEDYSYDCTNSMYLSVYIYEGTEEAQFEIFLKNNGNKTWAPDSKLINDPDSSFVTDVILLAQQKPNEERSYKITVKNLGKYPDNDYKIIFHFYSGGKIHGEKITALVQIKEKDKDKKSEVEEYNDKIKEFRETFNLAEDEYPDDKILEILKENEFNFENAFSSLFN